MDRQRHNNLWAEKLLQVSMPDSGEAWAGMEAILDRRLPQRFWGDRRRWLLLILLLLLLIGVCNCPGRGRLFRGSEHGSGGAGSGGTRFANPTAGPVNPAAGPASPSLPTSPLTAAAPAGAHSPGGFAGGGTHSNISPAPASGPSTPASRDVRSSPPAPASIPVKKHNPPVTAAAHHTGGPAAAPEAFGDITTTNDGTAGIRGRNTAKNAITRDAKNRAGETAKNTAGKNTAGKNATRDTAKNTTGNSTKNTTGNTMKNTAGNTMKNANGRTTKNAARKTTRRNSITTGDDTTRSYYSGRDTASRTSITTGEDTAKKKVPVMPTASPRRDGPREDSPLKDSPHKGSPLKDSPLKDSPHKDSPHKKPPPPPEEPKEKDHGWVFGIGLNQFFPIGGQKSSTYKTDGLTGTLSYYLPVPMIRYYLNRKTYIQLEAQLNTPQATKKDLVFNAVVSDSISIPGENVQTSATIQQLYYFNIPLSIHYGLTDDLNIGAGLQYSHLSNAIGNFDSTLTNLSTLQVTNPKETKSFKNDTLYRRIKTNEFRFLVDANYTWKHFIVGLRYNQALTKFINVPLPTGGATQSRNSSLQLYLRYILWDTRRKRGSAPK